MCYSLCHYGQKQDIYKLFLKYYQNYKILEIFLKLKKCYFHY